MGVVSIEGGNCVLGTLRNGVGATTSISLADEVLLPFAHAFHYSSPVWDVIFLSAKMFVLLQLLHLH